MAALHDLDEEERAYRKTAAYAWEEFGAAVRRVVEAVRAAFGR